MTEVTDDTRNRAFKIAAQVGYHLTHAGKGNRVVVRMTKDGVPPITALVKTASLGSAMVTAKSGDADTAKVSGFDDSITHVLFAVGNRRGDVAAYLVPKNEAEEAFRKAHRDWLVDHRDAADSTTWVIYFHDGGSPGANRYDEQWARYRLAPSGGATVAPSEGEASSTEHLTIAEAKRRLAKSLGVSADSVRITIEA